MPSPINVSPKPEPDHHFDVREGITLGLALSERRVTQIHGHIGTGSLIGHDVEAVAALEMVRAFPTDERVITCAAIERIVARAAENEIVAATAEDGVVPAIAIRRSSKAEPMTPSMPEK